MRCGRNRRLAGWTPGLVVACVLMGCATTDTKPSSTLANPPVSEELVRAVHSQAIVLDAHADIEYAAAPSRYALPGGVSRVAPEKLKLGGVDAVVMALAVDLVSGPKKAMHKRGQPRVKSCRKWLIWLVILPMRWLWPPRQTLF